MNLLNLVRSWALLLSALLVIAGLVIAITMLSDNHLQPPAMTAKQQATMDVIEDHDGVVMFDPASPLSITSVDLSNTVIDAELLQALSRCTGVERLKFDGGSLQPSDCGLLASLPQLRSLSLDRTNVTDAHIARLPQGLSNLSLNGTSITDKSMPYLAAMDGLTSLDIAGTDITAGGLQKLEPLTSLQRLWIDETCISIESAQSLQRMQPQSLDVMISEGDGKRTHAILYSATIPHATGNLRGGYRLWESDQAWSNTLAGVVDAVVAEAGLDSEHAARLLEALTYAKDLKQAKAEPPISATTFSFVAFSKEGGSEIASIEEFIERLQKERLGIQTRALIRYGKENFTANDIPKLLTAMRSTPSWRDNGLFFFGPFLLIQHGMGIADVNSELDRLLTHQEAFIRATTICAFGYGGASSFYSREQWMPSEAADAFAIQRVLPICKDESEYDQLRSDAWVVLAEIVQRRPQYAAEVVPVLIDALSEEVPSPYHPGDYLSLIAEVAPDATIASVPRLRATLARLDQQRLDASQSEPADIRSAHDQAHKVVLAALSATASASPELSQEIAFEYLDRLRDGLPTGPFAPLLSPDNPSATTRVVVELLDSPAATDAPTVTGTIYSADVAVGELESVAKKIRDWQTVL